MVASAGTILSWSQARRGLFIQAGSYCARTEMTRTPTTWCKSHIEFLVLQANTPNQNKKLKPHTWRDESMLEWFTKIFCYHSNWQCKNIISHSSPAIFHHKKYGVYILFSSSKTQAGCSWSVHQPTTSVSLGAGGKTAHCSGASQGVLLSAEAPYHDQLEKGSCSHTRGHSHACTAGRPHLSLHGASSCSRFRRWAGEESIVVTKTSV